MNAVLQVLPFAAASAISPLLFTFALLVASQKKSSLLKSLFFIFGSAVSIGIIGFVIFFILSKLSPGGTYTAKDAQLDALIGIVLILFAFNQLRKHKTQKSKPERNLKLWEALGLGFGFMTINASTIIMYIPAAHVASYYPVDVKFELLFIMMVFSLIPAIAPPVMLALIRSQKTIDSVKNFVNRNGSYIIAAVFGVLGVFELAKAIQFFIKG